MRPSFLRTFAAVIVLTFTVSAQDRLPVDKVLQFVRYSLANQQPGDNKGDKEVANYLSKVVLTEKLDPQVVEGIRRSGAGPRTVAALTRLAEASANLPAPAPVRAQAPTHDAAPQPPAPAVQQRIMGEVVEYARNYIPSLPDFLCLQVTRRSVDPHYQTGTPPSWSPSDRIVEKLSFVDHHEKYDLLTRNDNATTGDTWKSVGGALSRGDWATILEAIFDPRTETSFRWERYANLDGKLYHVYRYQVTQEHSKQKLEADHQEATPAFHGEIFIPSSESVIRRITVEPEPAADFPMQNIKETLNYDYVDISGHRFLLPLNSDLTMRTGRTGSRNEIEFRRYQKYSADADIKFDDVDDPPAH